MALKIFCKGNKVMNPHICMTQSYTLQKKKKIKRENGIFDTVSKTTRETKVVSLAFVELSDLSKSRISKAELGFGINVVITVPRWDSGVFIFF